MTRNRTILHNIIKNDIENLVYENKLAHLDIKNFGNVEKAFKGLASHYDSKEASRPITPQEFIALAYHDVDTLIYLLITEHIACEMDYQVTKTIDDKIVKKYVRPKFYTKQLSSEALTIENGVFVTPYWVHTNWNIDVDALSMIKEWGMKLSCLVRPDNPYGARPDLHYMLYNESLNLFREIIDFNKWLNEEDNHFNREDPNSYEIDSDTSQTIDILELFDSLIEHEE